MATATAAPLTFASWLAQDRVRRELVYNLEIRFEQIGSPFAFARRRGLAGLRALVDGLTDDTTPVFVALQGEENYNVVYRILPVILVRKKAAPISEITHAERQVALDLVHTICVIHPRSRQYFGSHQYIEALVGFLRIEQLQYATLQALEGALVDSGSNQESLVVRNRSLIVPRLSALIALQSFERLAGLKIICNILNNRKGPPLARVKAAEFLYLFLSPDQDEQGGKVENITSEEDLSERARNVGGYIGMDQLFMLLNMADLEDLEATCAVFVHEIDQMSPNK